ncbi:MAG: DUF58 domain-containing protein [Chloroflexota bacterium]
MALNRWLFLLGALFLIGVIFEVPVMVAFPTMLSVVFLVAAWWQSRSLNGMEYKRSPYYKRSFPGERVALQIEVENRKWLPLSWLRVVDPWPKAVGPEDEELMAPSHVQDEGYLTNIYSLRWFERARRCYDLIFRRRGVYRLGPARLESGDLFGIFECQKEVEPTEYLTVFPSLLSLKDLELTAEDPLGVRRTRRRLFEDPNLPMGVREYQPHDSFRRIHWPATARTGQLQVNIYQPVSARVMIICMNISTFARHWEGVNPERMEHLIELTATLAYRGVEAGYQVGLISNGTLSNSDQPFRILPGCSPKQLSRLLEALAGVTPVVIAPFERFLLQEAPGLTYGATLVVVTAVNRPELGEALVRLKRSGRRVIVFSVAKEPPPFIPGVNFLHRPYRPPAFTPERSPVSMSGTQGHDNMLKVETTKRDGKQAKIRGGVPGE